MGFVSHSTIAYYHHILHHKYYKYNYCLVFPIFDIIFDTYLEIPDYVEEDETTETTPTTNTTTRTESIPQEKNDKDDDYQYVNANENNQTSDTIDQPNKNENDKKED